MRHSLHASLIAIATIIALSCIDCFTLAETPATAPATTEPAVVEIKIDNFTFSPATVTIPAGTKVTWINHDDIPHTATSTAKVFNSKALDTDEKYSFTFNTPGTYPYFCAVHPHMTGQIIVK